MSEENDLFPDRATGEVFDIHRRGYSRQQVDEFVARCRNRVDELRDGLSRSIDEKERLRDEVAVLHRQAAGGKPDHVEVGERIAQILKLADEEARARRDRAQQDTATLRDTAQRDADRMREQAKAQSERMLTAAQEQAERSIASARSEAEKMRSEAEKTRITSRAEADRTAAEARKKAENVLATADAHAKRTVDDATARAAAMLAEAERRLNLLSTRHMETVRRLTEIRDDVAALLGPDAAHPPQTTDIAADAGHAGTPAGAGPTSAGPVGSAAGPVGSTGHADETMVLPAATTGSPARPGQQETGGQQETSSQHARSPVTGGAQHAGGSHALPPEQEQDDSTWPQRTLHGDEPPVGQAVPVARTADLAADGVSRAGHPGSNAAAGGNGRSGGRHDTTRSGGLSGAIDPDEPTEGVRLISE